jgi:hypothetical protein
MEKNNECGKIVAVFTIIYLTSDKFKIIRIED